MHHMCETWSQHTWCLCSRPGFGPLKSGCDRSGIRGMLTVGRNLDRTGQPIFTYLCYSDSFLKLFLIFSHLFPLYSDYPYLFLLKTNLDFTLWNPVPKVIFRNRRPNLKNKNKTNFFWYLWTWMFVLMILVWFGSLFECDGLWSNVHNYIYIYIMLIKLTKQPRISSIKISSLIDPCLSKIHLILKESSYPNQFTYIILK
jgi:hypothetical protein